jgi:hypothetical protein
MAELVDQGARGLREVPREELIGRLRDDSVTMMADFKALSADEWASLMVPHKYMGPLPAMFYPMFQIVDYAVHGWDIREGMRTPHAMSGDAADLLVPVIFVLWSATADVGAVDRPYTVGIRTTGHNGGDMRADVSSDGVQFSPGDIDDCDAVLEFDPATLVLTARSEPRASVRATGCSSPHEIHPSTSSAGWRSWRWVRSRSPSTRRAHGMSSPASCSRPRRG